MIIMSIIVFGFCKYRFALNKKDKYNFNLFLYYAAKYKYYHLNE